MKIGGCEQPPYMLWVAWFTRSVTMISHGSDLADDADPMEDFAHGA